ncbi:MAG: hypothetical protein JSU86_07665 [Phycisphaerales bacterium]|nr:MAG: hypothetical protein JSU86_07665 [Phycisphaerales bacterium]
MERHRLVRVMKLLAPGMILLQAAGCSVNDFLQTVFLAITAAGSIAILQNI